MADREFYRDHERDLGILARVASPGSDMHGFLIDDETAAAAQVLIEAAVGALDEGISRVPGKWTGEVALMVAVNFALHVAANAGWSSDHMKRIALESLKATLAACADSRIRELGFEPEWPAKGE
jgi:hypothetical protein